MIQPCITLDIDWSPDFVIDEVAQQLLDHAVRATWFVTHDSPAVDRLRRHPDLFELGIHPNFLPGSTHGATAEAVLAHCKNLVPDAVSVRTHGLVQSTPLLSTIMRQTTVQCDVSLFLPDARHVEMVEYCWDGRVLLRAPFIWEDDFAMQRSPANLRPAWMPTGGTGICIYNFHPMHVYLNSVDMQRYQKVKRAHHPLTAAPRDSVAALRNAGPGIGAVFAELVAGIGRSGASRRIVDLCRRWRERSATEATLLATA